MASFNRVILMGNLTRDPALKYLPNQTAVVEFGIAMNHKFKTADGEQREDVVFVDVMAFGKQAEVINEHFAKGKPILLEGRLKLDQWDDKQSGAKRSKLRVVLEKFTFVGGKGESDDESGADRGASTHQRPQSHSKTVADAISDERQFKEDDIPF